MKNISKKLYLVVIIGFMVLSSCSSIIRFSSNNDKDDSDFSQTFRGYASYYADQFHGRKTANGEIFDMNKMTAAHKTLPFNTKLRVTNLKNGRSVIVRINDRGPFAGNRVIDLSKQAAIELNMIRDGVIEVECEVLE